MEFFLSNKKRLALFFLVIFALVLSFSLSLLNQKKAEKVIPQKEDESQKVVNPFSGSKAGVGFLFKGEGKNLPSEAETFELLSRPLSSGEIKEVAAAFGFESDPVKSVDKVYGEVLFWNGDGKTLRIRPLQKTIKYSLKHPTSLVREALTVDQARRIAEDFLRDQRLFSDSLVFREEFEYLRGIEGSAIVSDALKAEAIKVTLTYHLSGFPLIDELLGPEPVSLTILNDGRVAFVSYLIFDPLDLKVLGKVSVKNLSEAQNDLSSGEGIAVGVLSPNPETASSLPFDRILKNVYFAYYRSLKTYSVQPVFVFENNNARVLVPAPKNF